MYHEAIIKTSFPKNIEHMIEITNKVSLVFDKRITKITEPRPIMCAVDPPLIGSAFVQNKMKAQSLEDLR
jgi:hypothetical protein